MNKSLIPILFILISIFSLLFWNYSFLLSVFLLILAYIKHRIIPIKKELEWFLLVSIGATLVEIMLVNVGHAWKYAVSHIYGVPLWMILFWGLTATTIISLYQGLIDK